MEKISQTLWGGFTIGLILLCGLYFTVKNGFVQLRLPLLLSGKASGKNRLKAVTAALAASMGTGNITGCGAAIAAGGAGAVLWMWVSAFLGMAVSFTENRLGAEYALKYPGLPKGPMLYMEKGLGSKTLGKVYALCCLGVAFAMGCMSQSRAFAESISECFGDMTSGGSADSFAPQLFGGLLIALLTGAVIFSSKSVGERVMSVTEKIVPVMGLLYAGGCIVLIARSQSGVGTAFREIIACGFTPRAAAGGAVGITVKKAVSVGLRRGVFSNEAGMGSSVLVHCDADFGSPEKAGAWAAFEVFLDTIVCCTLTALAVLTSPLYRSKGVCGVTEIFGDSLGKGGEFFACLCICAFAWAAVIGWCLYGEKCLKYLFPHSKGKIYRIAFCISAAAGGILNTGAALGIADIFNWCAMLPNLIVITVLTQYKRQEAGSKKQEI